MDFSLDAPALEIRDAARRFALEELAPRLAGSDAAGAFPHDLVRRLGQLGLLAAPLPPELGGRGASYVAYALVYEELGRVDAAFRGFLAVHGGLVTMCLRDHGTQAQRDRWLRDLAAGEIVGCYGLTEAGAGSDAAALAMTAERDGDTYRLNGEKVWITNGGVADLALVFARDPALPAEKPHRQICAFLVPTATPGFSAEAMDVEPLGHRSADHARLVLRDCIVPRANLLGEPGQGFRLAMRALDHGRLGVAAGAVGLGRACLAIAVDFAREREAFGQPIGRFQMIQASLADTSAAMDAARLLTYRAAWLKDEGRPSTRATATAKLFATEAALKAADEAVLILGSRGYGDAYPVGKHWRDVKGMQIYEGTSHIQRIVIARDLLESGPEAEW